MEACRAAFHENMSPLVWHNGRLCPVRQAAVPLTDLGLLYGHGFFETLRADRGDVPLLADHLARFQRTWQALMPGPTPDLSWGEVIAQVLEANNLRHRTAAVKILATRGSRTAAPWDHCLVVTARPYVHRLNAIGAEGLFLGIYPHPRQTPLADYKTLNYLFYHQAGEWASRTGHHEALILNPDGMVSETNTANLLLIYEREVVRPRSTAVLPGVMAAAVCRRLAEWGYGIVERPVRTAELLQAPQVLATNALMGAVPVLRVDARPRPQGGDLWVRLNDALIPGWK